MKQIFATIIAALVLAAGQPALPAAAADLAPPRLACADINGNATQSYYIVDSTTRTATLSVQITTVKPLCQAATLTVYLASDATGTTVLSSASYPGGAGFTACTPQVAGQGCLTYTKTYGSTTTNPSNAPANVYVFLETTIGPRVIDRAPNSGGAIFTLCDFDATTPDYDSGGHLILPCSGPGGEYFL